MRSVWRYTNISRQCWYFVGSIRVP